MNEPFILASKSSRRIHLFKQIGIPFISMESNAEESISNTMSPVEIVQDNAMQKASMVSENVENGLVIGADTVVCLGDKIYGKPTDSSHAKEMLKALSGEIHHVYTGVAMILVQNESEINKKYIFSERTKVLFSHIDNILLERYISYNLYMEKAGAYGIQDPISSLFIRAIEGDYYNVVGFPIHSFYKHLKIFSPYHSNYFMHD